MPARRVMRHYVLPYRDQRGVVVARSFRHMRDALALHRALPPERRAGRPRGAMGDVAHGELLEAMWA